MTGRDYGGSMGRVIEGRYGFCVMPSTKMSGHNRHAIFVSVLVARCRVNYLPQQTNVLITRFMQPTAYRISCIISTYCDAAYVSKKMEEIERQTIFDEVEFIFIETGSPECERELIRPYLDKFSNIKLLTTDDRMGLYQAWNMGWNAAQADVVCYSNMDDALHPCCLEYVANYMEARREKDLCSVMIAYQYETSKGDRDSFDSERLRHLKISRRLGPFTAWRKDVSERLGMFDENFQVMGDLDFWSRAIDSDVGIGMIYKVLYLYSVAPTQLSKSKGMETERRYSAGKGIGLSWLSWKGRLLLLHRKLFRLFPQPYLLPDSASCREVGRDQAGRD